MPHLPHPSRERAIHASAGIAARLLWAIADDLDRLQRVIYAAHGAITQAGHRALDAAIDWSEERHA